MSQYNLATAYQAAGRFDEALPHYEAAAAGLAAALGADHPNTVLVQASLGQAISACAWHPPTEVHREAGHLQARNSVEGIGLGVEIADLDALRSPKVDRGG